MFFDVKNKEKTQIMLYLVGKNQRYLTAIRTYFTRWLIRTKYTISMICLNPSGG